DAIIGLYRMVGGGAEKTLATLNDVEEPQLDPHLDLKNVKVVVVDGLFLKVTFETRGPVLAEGDPGVAGISYRVSFDSHKPLTTRTVSGRADAVWTISGLGRAGGGAGRGSGGAGWLAFGLGVLPHAAIQGDSVSFQGQLPE